MKMSLGEYYNKCFTTYYMWFDNKGNFKQAHGIVGNSVVKEAEKLLKGYLTKRRKTDVYTEILYSNEKREISSIQLISKGRYERSYVSWKW